MVTLGIFSEMYIKEKLIILSCLNAFVTCSAHFNMPSESSISLLGNTVGR